MEKIKDIFATSAGIGSGVVGFNINQILETTELALRVASVACSVVVGVLVVCYWMAKVKKEIKK